MSDEKFKLHIGHLYPDLLNLYGDRGNIKCLEKRSLKRNIDVKLSFFEFDDKIDFSDLDIVLLGGGSDKEQELVCQKLQTIKKQFKDYVENNGVVIAVCGGYQLLGNYYQTATTEIRGLELVDIYTTHGQNRLIDNIVLKNELWDMPIVGFENHGGRTFIGDYRSFGKILYGSGNDEESGYEGIMYKNVIGTYLHGPLLPKNPQVCDYLIANALKKKYGVSELCPLDDKEEIDANGYMVKRLLNK